MFGYSPDEFAATLRQLSEGVIDVSRVVTGKVGLSEVAQAFEVGIGKDGGTQLGEYQVGDKKEDPMWFRQGQKPVPFGSPENPLGTRWIAWLSPAGETTGLGFHGTNQPESIGKDESQGCIRMRNADVEELFEILPKGAAIHVQPCGPDGG